jgi:hypothetical protein
VAVTGQIQADVYSIQSSQNTTLAPSPIPVLFTLAVSAVGQ